MEQFMPSTGSTRDTIIHDPGKFEGEHVSVPHFWEQTLDGCTDEVFADDIQYSFIVIDDDDRAQFPDLKEYGLVVYEDSQGFVHALWFDSKEQFEETRAELEKAGEEESDDDPEYD
jgi:hypothetical protein